MSDIVNKLWGFCHQMRHDGIDYGDYIEQLTYLLFLKMSDEKGIELQKISWINEKHEKITTDCSWSALRGSSGTAVLHHFSEVLRALSNQQGMLGDIFAQSKNQFNTPVNLKKIITLIDGKSGPVWMWM